MTASASWRRDCLLRSCDPPPFHTVNAAGRSPVTLVCDHGGRAVPRALGDLGLPRDAFERHIAWDIYAAAVVRRMAARLDAAAVIAGYSRLVIDNNRAPGEPDSIPEASDGTVIPANRAIGPAGRLARERDIFHPYHRRIEDLLNRRWLDDRPPVLVSIHSFTAEKDGEDRPWHVGVMWDCRDPRLAVPVMEALAADGRTVVGDNKPYSPRIPPSYTVPVHAERYGRAHLAIELRQDLVSDAAGATSWGDRLVAALAPLLAEAERVAPDAGRAIDPAEWAGGATSAPAQPVSRAEDG